MLGCREQGVDIVDVVDVLFIIISCQLMHNATMKVVHVNTPMKNAFHEASLEEDTKRHCLKGLCKQKTRSYLSYLSAISVSLKKRIYQPSATFNARYIRSTIHPSRSAQTKCTRNCFGFFEIVFHYCLLPR